MHLPRRQAAGVRRCAPAGGPGAPARKLDLAEKREQLWMRGLIAHLGGAVWVAGTTRRKGDYQGTMQTPGLPDLPHVFLPEKRAERLALGFTQRHLVIECKRPKTTTQRAGRLRAEQKDFRDLALAAGLDYLAGGFDVFVAWLIANKYVREDQVAHYRVQS